MSKNTKIIFFALCIIVIFIATYYFFISNKKTVAIEQVSDVSGVAYNTYSDGYFGFRYPDFLILEKSEDTIYLKEDKFILMHFKIFDNQNNLSVEEFSRNIDGENLFDSTMPESVVPITVSGKMGLKFTPYITESGHWVYVIPFGSNILRIVDRQGSSVDANGVTDPGFLSEILPTISFKK